METKKLLVVKKIEIEKSRVTIELQSGKDPCDSDYDGDLTMAYVSFPLEARSAFNIGDEMEVIVRPVSAVPTARSPR